VMFSELLGKKCFEVDHWRALVLAEKNLSATQKCVAQAFAFFMDFETLENARPSAARVMALADCSRSTVRKTMRKLEDLGYVECVRRGALDGSASVYKGAFPPTTPFTIAQYQERLERQRASEAERRAQAQAAKQRQDDLSYLALSKEDRAAHRRLMEQARTA